MQGQSERGQQASAARIGELERESADSREIHLALAAQHETKVRCRIYMLCCPASGCIFNCWVVMGYAVLCCAMLCCIWLFTP